MIGTVLEPKEQEAFRAELGPVLARTRARSFGSGAHVRARSARGALPTNDQEDALPETRSDQDLSGHIGSVCLSGFEPETRGLRVRGGRVQGVRPTL